jgi:lysophospholipase L1-like esterase
VTDLEDHWEGDCLALNPDIVNILVGVNDAASVLELTIPPPSRTDGLQQKSLVTREMFHDTYDRLLKLTRSRLPKVRIILCTPFVLPVDKIEKNWNLWNGEVSLRASMIQSLANSHGAELVEFQPVFDKVIHSAPASFWIPDGVHPSAAGHQIMADEWFRMASSKASGN